MINGEALDIERVPVIPPDDFQPEVTARIEKGMRIAAFFGQPIDPSQVRLWVILADERAQRLHPLCTDPEKGRYLSLTPGAPQAHWFEREIYEQWSIHPVRHPWLKPIRFHAPYRTDGLRKPYAGKPVVGTTEFFRVEGDEIHEVAVGPVHAGIIEPGHFRFQCHGEDVLHLEISLGYQHRGAERKLAGCPGPRAIHLIETLSGDATVGHATAYCEAFEALSGAAVPARGLAVRGIALELERIANHTGDLGALAGDIGFLPTLSYCGRIRGDILNMTALICGNRFGRGIVRPGGVGFDLGPDRAAELRKRLETAKKDLSVAVGLMFKAASVMARFEGTGAVGREAGEAIGLVGPAARGCGIDRDVRRDFPAGIFRTAQIPVSVSDSGDVLARAQVRWMEIERSVAFIFERLEDLPEGETRIAPGRLSPNRAAVSLVEGWRGEICHVALTDREGRLAHYKVVDPSFHNWFGLALALRDQQISDFPLCNKSFNLSYCGHDL